MTEMEREDSDFPFDAPIRAPHNATMTAHNNYNASLTTRHSQCDLLLAHDEDLARNTHTSIASKDEEASQEEGRIP